MPLSKPISAAPQRSPIASSAGPVFKARLEPNGPTFNAPAWLTLLQSAEMAGLELTSSCRNGTCRTCLCHLASGQVAYRVEWPGLSTEERQSGCILPCVAYPASDVVLQLPA